MRLLGAAFVACIGLALSGCQVRSTVEVTMEPSGRGSVVVTVALDKAAAAKVPDLATDLRTGDLQAAGWKIVGPALTSGGGVRISASRPFANPNQANVILGELSGVDGPFKDLTLRRTHSFGKDQYRFDGTMDVSKGIGAFADTDFLKALGSQRVDQVLGGDVNTDRPTVSLSVRLPGTVHAGPGAEGQPPTWASAVGAAPVVLHASSEKRSGEAFFYAAVAAAAMAGLVLTGLLVLVSRIRSRRPASSSMS